MFDQRLTEIYSLFEITDGWSTCPCRRTTNALGEAGTRAVTGSAANKYEDNRCAVRYLRNASEVIVEDNSRVTIQEHLMWSDQSNSKTSGADGVVAPPLHPSL